MWAIQTLAPGGWDATSLCEIGNPVARADDLLVNIGAVGINPADAHQIIGTYPGGPRPPFIPGRDAAGTIAHDASDGAWQRGDRVVILQSSATNLANGTLAERQAVPKQSVATFPASWTLEEGAAAPLVYLTAWKALVDIGGVQPGTAVVVTGASGGVGLAAVQLAHALGATVVALSRQANQHNMLQNAGATACFSPDDSDLKSRAFAAVGKKGFDIAVDTVGGDLLGLSVHLLGVYGKVAAIGVLAGMTGSVPIPSLMFKRASIHGVLVTDDAPEKAQQAWQGICGALERTGAKPVVAATYSWHRFRDAFQRLEAGVTGKVVLTIDGPPSQ